MVGAAGFEPATSCSQSTCAAFAPRPDGLMIRRPGARSVRSRIIPDVSRARARRLRAASGPGSIPEIFGGVVVGAAVRTRSTAEVVALAAAGEGVIARLAAEKVHAGIAVELVVPGEPEQHVRPGCPVHGVVATGADPEAQRCLAGGRPVADGDGDGRIALGPGPGRRHGAVRPAAVERDTEVGQ